MREAIENAKLYEINDMVKIGANDCLGCHACCQGMGESIVLDAYDIWQLETHLHTTFAGLLQETVALHVSDGLILPSLKMQASKEQCGFLTTEGRCGIHDFRPGLCRLFPLGRHYEDGKLFYFLLEGACPVSQHTKMKVKKWLSVPDSRKYEEFLVTWHDLRKGLQTKLTAVLEQEEGEVLKGDGSVPDIETEKMEWVKKVNMNLLHIFYELPYEPEDFYGQFAMRMRAFEEAVWSK